MRSKCGPASAIYQMHKFSRPRAAVATCALASAAKLPRKHSAGFDLHSAKRNWEHSGLLPSLDSACCIFDMGLELFALGLVASQLAVYGLVIGELIGLWCCLLLILI